MNSIYSIQFYIPLKPSAVLCFFSGVYICQTVLFCNEQWSIRLIDWTLCLQFRLCMVNKKINEYLMCIQWVKVLNCMQGYSYQICLSIVLGKVNFRLLVVGDYFSFLCISLLFSVKKKKNLSNTICDCWVSNRP